MNKKKLQWIYRIALVMVMIAIFCFSSQPGIVSAKVSDTVANKLQIEPKIGYKNVSAQPIFAGLSLRKYAHIIMYFLLGLFAALSFIEKSCLISFFICFFYSCSDEFHQIFVPGRGAAVKDLAVDFIGYGVAILLVYIVSSLILKNTIKRINPY